MFKRKVLFLLAVAALIFQQVGLAHASWLKNQSFRGYVSLRGGGSVAKMQIDTWADPPDDADQAYSDFGLALGGAVGVRINNGVDLEIEYLHKSARNFDLEGARYGVVDESDVGGVTPYTYDKPAIDVQIDDLVLDSVLLNMNVYMFNLRKLGLPKARFVASLGAGYYWGHLDASFSTRTDTIFENQLGISEVFTGSEDANLGGFTWQIGGGLEYQVSNHVRVGLMYRLQKYYVGDVSLFTTAHNPYVMGEGDLLADTMELYDKPSGVKVDLDDFYDHSIILGVTFLF
jgi:opacity protein-like surface antigen